MKISAKPIAFVDETVTGCSMQTQLFAHVKWSIIHIEESKIPQA